MMRSRRRNRPKVRQDPDTITVDAEFVDSWLTVADVRENDGVWVEVESLLNELQNNNPMRARMARQAIRWLRHEALRYELKWGKDMNSYAEPVASEISR